VVDDSSTGPWSVAASSADEVDRRQRGGRSIRLRKVVVLGFFFCKDKDLPDAGLSSSSLSGELRKAPSANIIVHLLSGVCWIGWYSVACTHAFIPDIWF
jgi:hypothetical protein